MDYIDGYRVTKCQKKAPPPEVINTMKALYYYDNFYIDFVNTVSSEQIVQIGGNIFVNKITYPSIIFTGKQYTQASIKINNNIISSSVIPLGYTPVQLLNFLNSTNIGVWTYVLVSPNVYSYTCTVSQGNYFSELSILDFFGNDYDETPSSYLLVLDQNPNVTVTINETENLTTFLSTQGQYNYDVRYVLVQANTPEQVIQPIEYIILDANGVYNKKLFELTKDIRQVSETSLLYPVKFIMNVRNKIDVNMLPNQSMRMTFYYIPNEYECIKQKTSGIEDTYLPPFRKRKTMYDNKMLYPNDRLRY